MSQYRSIPLTVRSGSGEATFADRWPSIRRIIGRVVLYTVIIAGAVLELIPLFYMLTTSLKPYDELFRMPPTWIPERFAWENYPLGLTFVPFGRYFINTMVIAVGNIAGQMLAASLAAFSFARLRWPLRDKVFLVYLASMMIPESVTIIPEYIIYKEIGFINTFIPLIIPSWFGGPYFIFLLRQFFLTIPREMDDAARIDGCSNFGIYWRIILPLAKPALGVVAIYQFRGAWNAFFRPLIFLHSSSRFTLALGLRMFHQEFSQLWYWNQLMAASIVVTLPVLIIFFFLQRMFIQGIVITGVKG